MAHPTKKELIQKSNKTAYIDWFTNNLQTLGTEKTDAILRAQEHKQKLFHRNCWSFTLIVITITLNIVSLFVIIAIGAKWLVYDSPAAVPSVIAANFAETWILSKIAVKFYFNNNDNDRAKP